MKIAVGVFKLLFFIGFISFWVIHIFLTYADRLVYTLGNGSGCPRSAKEGLGLSWALFCFTEKSLNHNLNNFHFCYGI